MLHDDHSPSAVGLLRCLRMLAEEADALQLTQTLAALQLAMETCQNEAIIAALPLSLALH